MAKKNDKIVLKEIRVANDGTHHIYHGKPLYERRFNWVLKFHEPGLAPVGDNTGAFHITVNGNPAYTERYKRTFGFYYNRAAVITKDGWCHIDPTGKPIYNQRYAWVGNYQDSLCTVRSFKNEYFHITLDGTPAYDQRWLYAGDFRDGIACVIDKHGWARHIYQNGEFVHNGKWLELDVYHKGFARARDEKGWCHINIAGEAIYPQRYLNVEPFYNGYALVRDFKGTLGIIDENGTWIHTIRKTEPQDFEQIWNYVTDLMVAYWKSCILYAAAKTNIFDAIQKGYTNVKDLAAKLNLDFQALRLFIQALNALQLVSWNEDDDNKLFLLPQGKLFTESHNYSLKSAAIMWAEEHYKAWNHLDYTLRTGESSFTKLFGKPFFDWLDENPKKLQIYQEAMSAYAKKDYLNVTKKIDFSKHTTVLDIGGGIGILLSYILKDNPHLRGILLERKEVVNTAEKFLKAEGVLNRCQLISGDFKQPLNLRTDAIILSRVLHDWDDNTCLTLLQHAHKYLEGEGKLYIIELLLPQDPKNDLGALLNLNMAVMTTGRERTLSDYIRLLEKTNFKFIHTIELSPINSIIVASKG